MMMKTWILLCLVAIVQWKAIGQEKMGRIEGRVWMQQIAVANAIIEISPLAQKVKTNEQGKFEYALPFGTYQLHVNKNDSFAQVQEVVLSAAHPVATVHFHLQQQDQQLKDVVITGTKTAKNRSESAVKVQLLTAANMEQVQACNLAEGLKYQAGLRMETNCQTCNYTQLRMNGLGGGYSQILMNGRPLMSALTGLYGLEQLPVNRVERVEIIRGGGSSLYGTSAVGGTVNIITKVPKQNDLQLNYNYQSINGVAQDHLVNAQRTLVTQNRKAGIIMNGNMRHREAYDANGDFFSELPQLKQYAAGIHAFYQIDEQQKIELDAGYVFEFRYGGDMKQRTPHLSQQSEERKQHLFTTNLDYQYQFKNKRASLITYAAMQQTMRKHYTGILPDSGSAEYQQHVALPPYGQSHAQTYNAGLQLNYLMHRFLGGKNQWTLGSEYIEDAALDEIPAYHYHINQRTKNLGAFLQSDWQIVKKLSLLSGLRWDHHNLLQQSLWSPRMAMLYRPNKQIQARLSYGSGFRAPQAFDADWHISFAGGGVSRIQMAPQLLPERSRSWTSSFSIDQPMESFIAGITIEGFYTRLLHAFYLQHIGADNYGEIFQKQNGSGATVKGLSIEWRANWKQQWQLEGSYTLQSNEYDEAWTPIENVTGTKKMMRTPSRYGYAVLSFMPDKKFKAVMNAVYTGPMLLPHFAGADNQHEDEMVRTKSFYEVGMRLSYLLPFKQSNMKWECFAGVKNIFNQYQNDFDLGKNRDSNFIYGPSQPRVFFVGVGIKK